MSKSILITGANGRVGSALVKYLDKMAAPYRLRLADLDLAEERSVTVDVTDFASCQSASFGGLLCVLRKYGSHRYSNWCF